MIHRATSVNGVPIRLSDERWRHIVEHHDDLAGHFHDVLDTIVSPEALHEGDAGELLAVSALRGSRVLVVVYREVGPGDGFVITAFFTSRVRQIQRRRLVWKRAQS
jgi:hypothetical protein